MIDSLGKLAVHPEVLFIHELNMNGNLINNMKNSITSSVIMESLSSSTAPNIDSFSPAIANVLSHFFILFALWVTARKMERYFFVFIDFLVVYVVSSNAHMCEMFLGNGCPFESSQLWFMDHISSESAMIFVAVVFVKCKRLEREIALQTILTIGLVFYKLYTDTQYYTGSIALVLFVYGLCVNNYVMEHLSMGIITSGSAFILFYAEKQNRDIYYEVHPLWHVLAFISLGFYILACEWKEDGILILWLRKMIREKIRAHFHPHAYDDIMESSKKRNEEADVRNLTIIEGENVKHTPRHGIPHKRNGIRGYLQKWSQGTLVSHV